MELLCYISTSTPKAIYYLYHFGSDSKESACNAEDMGSIPESGRSPGEGNGYPLQYFCLRNPMTEEPVGLRSMESQRVRYD